MSASVEQLRDWGRRLAAIQDEMGGASKGSGQSLIEKSVEIAWQVTYAELQRAHKAERHPVEVSGVGNA